MSSACSTAKWLAQLVGAVVLACLLLLLVAAAAFA
jgi:succinate dehydrogenase hydrophobic anchor subunit